MLSRENSRRLQGVGWVWLLAAELFNCWVCQWWPLSKPDDQPHLLHGGRFFNRNAQFPLLLDRAIAWVEASLRVVQ
jgi:hypothetical protein